MAIINDERIDISSHEVELNNRIQIEGIPCRERVEPKIISITTEDTYIPPTALDLYYSDGMAKGKTVPAGTILSDGRTEISEEVFRNNYIPYLDEEGNEVEGKYIRVIPAIVLPNPYGKPVVKTNPNGYVIESGDENCYLAKTVTSDILGLHIYSAEQVNKLFVPYSSGSDIKKL